MTKAEYTAARDEFTRALTALRELEPWFVEDIDYDRFDDDDEISSFVVAQELDRMGYWLSGDEYRDLEAAIALLERLVGRAHGRAV